MTTTPQEPEDSVDEKSGETPGGSTITDPEVSQQPGEPTHDRGSTGDDERDNREHIKKTGEPIRDALGNADGAS